MEKSWYKKWWFFPVVAFLILIGFIAVFSTLISEIFSPFHEPVPTQPIKQTRSVDPFTKMTSLEHLKEAKKALAEYNLIKDSMPNPWSRLADAKASRGNQGG